MLWITPRYWWQSLNVGVCTTELTDGRKVCSGSSRNGSHRTAEVIAFDNKDIPSSNAVARLCQLLLRPTNAINAIVGLGFVQKKDSSVWNIRIFEYLWAFSACCFTEQPLCCYQLKIVVRFRRSLAIFHSFWAILTSYGSFVWSTD